MAKLDTTKIEGYDAMTPEQKVAALEAMEYEDNSSEIERYKNAVSKANSEAAEWRKKHNALLSEDEKKKQESAEELENLRQQVAEMKKNELISEHKSKFIALGYEENLAAETALAMVEGDAEKVFANQKKFLENHDKAYKASLMGNTDIPPAGNNSENGTDYSKLIQDAQARGDVVAEAYYTRLSEQEKNK